MGDVYWEGGYHGVSASQSSHLRSLSSHLIFTFLIFTSSNYQSSLLLSSLLWFHPFLISSHLKNKTSFSSHLKTQIFSLPKRQVPPPLFFATVPPVFVNKTFCGVMNAKRNSHFCMLHFSFCPLIWYSGAFCWPFIICPFTKDRNSSLKCGEQHFWAPHYCNMLKVQCVVPVNVAIV